MHYHLFDANKLSGLKGISQGKKVNKSEWESKGAAGI
jgi:hypothetical protein